MCEKLPLCVRNTLKRRFDSRGGAVKRVQACLVPVKMEKAVFSSVEVLYSWSKPVYGRKTHYNAISTAKEVLLSTCRPV